MGDFTQPQQKYAGTGENCKIAIAVIVYPGIKRVSTQILNLRAKINFAKMLKIIQKAHKLPDFWTIFKLFAKLFSALK